jgi:hypothetical protein
MRIVEHTFKNSLQEIGCGQSCDNVSAAEKEEEDPF